ncbi:Dihydropyrimidinase-Related Protein 4 [Manis pentadactyla]|nr:Dihydropyrimidinase-Related Protein 4 [Manis pentadactyla]
MAHTRSWLSTAPRSGCCRYAVCPVQCGLSTELRDELEGDMNFIFFQSGKDRTDCHKTSMVFTRHPTEDLGKMLSSACDVRAYSLSPGEERQLTVIKTF